MAISSLWNAGPHGGIDSGGSTTMRPQALPLLRRPVKRYGDGTSNPSGARRRGKEKRLSLGVYPDVSLRDARDRRDEARKLLVNGTTPTRTVRSRKPPRSSGGASRVLFPRRSREIADDRPLGLEEGELDASDVDSLRSQEGHRPPDLRRHPLPDDYYVLIFGNYPGTVTQPGGQVS